MSTLESFKGLSNSGVDPLIQNIMGLITHLSAILQGAEVIEEVIEESGDKDREEENLGEEVRQLKMKNEKLETRLRQLNDSPKVGKLEGDAAFDSVKPEVKGEDALTREQKKEELFERSEINKLNK